MAATDWRSQYNYEIHPRATPAFPAPVDFPDRALKVMSDILTDKFGEEYGVKIQMYYERSGNSPESS